MGEIKMYCNKCGKEMPDTAKFCAACGAPVADKDQADISSTGETVDKGNHTKQIAGIACRIRAGGHDCGKEPCFMINRNN